MAKKEQRKWIGYLNYSLDKSDYSQLKKNAANPPLLLDWIAEMVEYGGSFSIAWNEARQAVRCSITFWKENHRLNGYTVAAFASDSTRALQEIHYVWSSGKYGEDLEGLPTKDEQMNW